jgi:formiminotetrahydrofolate cyclodeaminase
MSDYQNQSLKKYLDDLAAKVPAPGGGSAAAMTAAMGAALLNMVVHFTLGKPRYAKYEGRLKKILEDSHKLQQEFLSLVDLDVVAYQSKDLRKALDVPFSLCRLCFEAAKLAPELAVKGNSNLVSDVGVAVVLFEAAFACGLWNVEANLSILKDTRLSALIRRELLHKQSAIKKIRLQTEVKVGKVIRG